MPEGKTGRREGGEKRTKDGKRARPLGPLRPLGRTPATRFQGGRLDTEFPSRSCGGTRTPARGLRRTRMFLARPPGCAGEQVTTKKRGGPGTSLIAAGPAWLQSNDASGHDQRRRSPAGPWRTWRVVSRSGCRYCSEVSFLWLVSGFRPSIAFDWRLAAGCSPPVINESSSVFSEGGGRREWHVSAARPNKDGLAFDWQRTFFCGLLATACNAGSIIELGGRTI